MNLCYKTLAFVLKLEEVLYFGEDYILENIILVPENLKKSFKIPQTCEKNPFLLCNGQAKVNNIFCDRFKRVINYPYLLCIYCAAKTKWYQ